MFFEVVENPLGIIFSGFLPDIKDIGGLYFSAMDIGLTDRDLFRFMRLYTGKSRRQTLREDLRFWKAVRCRAAKIYRKEFGRVPQMHNC